MERLTNKHEADAQREEYERRLANGYPRNIPEERFLRLASYEDTGLTPESMEALKLSMMGKAILEITEFEGLPIERLKALARADREGRVVVLPCKVGDTVYVSYGEGYRPCVVDRIHVLSKNEVQIRARYPTTETLSVSASDFSKTVFLTREEAKEALRRAENGNQ